MIPTQVPDSIDRFFVVVVADITFLLVSGRDPFSFSFFFHRAVSTGNSSNAVELDFFCLHLVHPSIGFCISLRNCSIVSPFCLFHPYKKVFKKEERNHKQFINIQGRRIINFPEQK